MIELAAFEVIGLPAPQGSKTRVPNGAMLEGGSATGRAKQKAWRADVAAVARDVAADTDAPFDQPLRLVVEFRLPMPMSRSKAARVVGKWPHAVKPDIDKVIRATLDGLTAGGLIKDDARVFAIEASAYEVTGWTGAEIMLEGWAA